MVIAVTLFSALDAAAKYLVTREHVPLTQMLWCRFLVQFAGLLIIVPALGIMTARDLFRTNRLGLQSLRSLLMVSVTGLNFMALQYLRLDQTITITFLAPLTVALLAGPLLGEWVGWRRLVAILVGFFGIVVAVRPGFGDVPPAVLYSLGAMLTYSSFMLLTRYLAGADPPLVTLFWSMIAGTLLGAPVALLHWQPPPDLLSWGLLSSLGILGGTGHWLFIHAYRLAPASVVTPFLYAQLLSMAAFGYAVFGDLPDAWTLAGAAIVIASGVYLFHREHVAARQRARRPAE